MNARWAGVEAVLLDMDGTLLDLAFDDDFWQQRLPRAYARRHRLSLVTARAHLAPWFESQRGRLNWYCLDWWSRQTGIDLIELTRRSRTRIAVLPGALDFLDALAARGLAAWLVTNAHPAGLTLKLERTGLTPRFARIVCAHELGVPKEDPRFWPALHRRHAFPPQRTILIDDNLEALAAANRFGIGQVLAIRRPNSQRAPREIGGLPAVDTLADLLPISY
ncbi:MAG: GMP/IMP nucleotidase [Gammaproteobacteria bacterium]|nr:GMP/IMP nucleotidase [Gammaproteobacteria bacterium]